MQITIIHAHNNNRGDEAAIKAMIDEIRIIYPNSRVIIYNNGNSAFPNMDSSIVQNNRFPIVHSKLSQLDFFAILYSKGKIVFSRAGKSFVKNLRNSDIVIHAPGGPSIGDIYYKAEFVYLLRLLLIKKLEIPYIFYSPSMGPFYDKKREKLRKKVIRGAEIVYVRDPISYKYVKEFVPDVNVKLAMDSALQHDIDSVKYEEIYEQYTELKTFVETHEKCIGITITDLKWHPVHGKTDIFVRINAVFHRFIDFIVSKGYGVLFIPQLYGTSDDATYMSKFMKTKHTFVVSATENKYDSYFQQHVIGKMYAVVGMRYHSNIFSAKMGTPFVSISYEQKMRGFMESTGLSDYCIDLKDLSYEKLVSKFRQLEENYDEYANKLKVLHEPMKEKAFMPTQAIIDFLESKYAHK